MYGDVLRHDQLDREVHEKVYQMFDRANFATFEHLARMIARGKIVDHRGRDAYMTQENAKNLKVPITLIQGTKNRLFRPSGAHKTLNWMIENGPADHHFSLIELADFGHLDTFIGKDAPKKAFPEIVKAIEAGVSRQVLQ
jgi:cholesterol oxidase